MWVAWLLFRRVTKSRSRAQEGVRLTKEEEEELLAEWKPEPLVPEVDPNHPALHVPIVSGKVYFQSVKTILFDIKYTSATSSLIRIT